MITRKSLMSSIMTSLGVSSLAAAVIAPTPTKERFNKPQNKTKFKQNQRKELKASARKKAK